MVGQSNKNGKTHWYYLLKDMAWMAVDFNKKGN